MFRLFPFVLLGACDVAAPLPPESDRDNNAVTDTDTDTGFTEDPIVIRDLEDFDAGVSGVCWLEADGLPTCAGRKRSGVFAPPRFDLKDLDTGWWSGCGLDGDGTPTCWGDTAKTSTRLREWPDLAFEKVAWGVNHACGLDGDQIVCWGDPSLGALDVPAGTWSRVTTGWAFSCGEHSEGGIECWGYGSEFFTVNGA